MKRFSIALLSLCALSLSAASFGQIRTTPGGARSDAILRRIRQVEAIVNVLPVVFTKDQLKVVVPALAKARALELDIRKSEDTELLKLEAKLDKAYKDGIDKGIYPPDALQAEVATLVRALQIRRQLAMNEMIDMVQEALKKTLNEGQIKVMANTVKPEKIDPRLDPAKMSQDEKLRLYIRVILLDESSYELLLEFLAKPDK